ncbi:MAG: hypothetical protein J0H31_10470 [Alphaproteobacteria bacterium]|nr:hypothetical protein [Alphaproteobacteria bacterium]
MTGTIRNPAIPLQPRRIVILAASALMVAAILLPPGSQAQTPEGGIGEIVQPATGAGRAIYAPLDQAVILPRFLGRWAVRSGKCVGQKYTDRMELSQRLAILAGRSLTVQAALVEAGPQGGADDGPSPRADDYADADDLLVGFDQPDGDGPRYIHFRFEGEGGRLIVEEVGKPRRAYVRCS